MVEKKSAELFSALGNNIRFKIVCELAAGEQCVCRIFKKLDLPQNLVSHHLGILRANGLITDRKEGKWVYYSLNKNTFKESKKLLENFLNKKKN